MCHTLPVLPVLPVLPTWLSPFCCSIVTATHFAISCYPSPDLAAVHRKRLRLYMAKFTAPLEMFCMALAVRHANLPPAYWVGEADGRQLKASSITKKKRDDSKHFPPEHRLSLNHLVMKARIVVYTIECADAIACISSPLLPTQPNATQSCCSPSPLLPSGCSILSALFM